MKEAKKQYTVQLEPEFVEKLDKLASKLGLSRSQLMRNLMKSAYEDAKMLDKFGLFTAFQFGEKVVKKVKEGMASGKISLDKDGDLKITD